MPQAEREAWVEDKGIVIDYIKPDSPSYQNGFVERFNRTYREEVLGMYLFNTLDEVRDETDRWIELYNNVRPHESLNDMTPVEYLRQAASILQRYCVLYGVFTVKR